jgi:hypothetical protein
MLPVNIIQLRQLLRDKFPGLRTRADELAVKTVDGWPTGLPQLDARLGGGLAKSAITEVITARSGSGGALLLDHLLRQAAATNQFVALVDGQDSFDAAAGEPSALSRLLWIRCGQAEEAMKATDLVLRDGNLPIVLLDLALNPESQLRKIPAPTWYRFQRIVEESTAVFVVLTPRAMISPAQARVTLRSRFDLRALEQTREELLGGLEFQVTDARRIVAGEPLRKSA